MPRDAYFKVKKLDVIIMVLTVHLVQDTVNPNIALDGIGTAIVLGVTGAATLLLSSFLGRAT